ncbi:hypothetical protein SB30_270021 [Klebsiella quasipneumoniae subsp. similipneumoniae]|nr:hypothetical protein SB30_270021 [Klebsiella quasipneumoniae subsp. similipneumoniae]
MFKIHFVPTRANGTNVAAKTHVNNHTYREKYHLAKAITAISITAKITNVRKISFNSYQKVFL